MDTLGWTSNTSIAWFLASLRTLVRGSIPEANAGRAEYLGGRRNTREPPVRFGCWPLGTRCPNVGRGVVPGARGLWTFIPNTIGYSFIWLTLSFTTVVVRSSRKPPPGGPSPPTSTTSSGRSRSFSPPPCDRRHRRAPRQPRARAAGRADRWLLPCFHVRRRSPSTYGVRLYRSITDAGSVHLLRADGTARSRRRGRVGTRPLAAESPQGRRGRAGARWARRVGAQRPPRREGEPRRERREPQRPRARGDRERRGDQPACPSLPTV